MAAGPAYRDEFRAVVASELAHVERDVSYCREVYERGGETHAFWALYDLRGSAAYRRLAGDQEAFVRAEVFVTTVRRFFRFYSGVEILREMGDAVLVKSEGLRPILEVTCLYDSVARLWHGQRSEAVDISLAAKAAVVFGRAVRLDRSSTPDYVGGPLDRLARLATENQPPDVLLMMEDEARKAGEELLSREYVYLRAHGPKVLSGTLVKAGETPLRFWEVSVDRQRLLTSTTNFLPFREPM